MSWLRNILLWLKDAGRPVQPWISGVIAGLARVFDWVRTSTNGSGERINRRSGRTEPASNGADDRGEGRLDVEIAPAEAVFDPLEEGVRIYAIGDVHGRADLLEKLLFQIEDDCAEFVGQAHIVFLGDYVDRGLESRRVIDILLEVAPSNYQTVFLCGNHEEAMLSFLGDYTKGPIWANYGGRETLVSYGVRPPRSLALGEDWLRAHTDFRAALPREHEIFLNSLKTHAQIGQFGFVHAGVRPGVPFNEQSDRDRLWIRDSFLTATRREDLIIVHGHTPSDAPHIDARRIGIDTGAYFTGRLTAVRIEGDEIDFLSTSL